MTIRGSCLCGGVKFELSRVIGPFEICHCSRCRKVSGGQGVAAVGVNPADYKLVSGHDLIGTYTAPILHAPPPYHVDFCKVCGSPVPPVSPTGDFMEIAAGLLDDDPGIKPDKHIFVELIPKWDVITDGLPAYTREELIKLRRGQA